MKRRSTRNSSSRGNTEAKDAGTVGSSEDSHGDSALSLLLSMAVMERKGRFKDPDDQESETANEELANLKNTSPRGASSSSSSTSVKKNISPDDSREDFEWDEEETEYRSGSELSDEEPELVSDDDSRSDSKSAKIAANAKKRTHPHVLGKNKFKDASVQVLLEQRKKGVKCLSPKEIWTYIQQEELLDTKGKTPQSSLCAALSLDVKKGDASVFVKVGTGMYALREDPDGNADLRHYLHAVKNFYSKSKTTLSEDERKESRKAARSKAGSQWTGSNNSTTSTVLLKLEQERRFGPKTPLNIGGVGLTSAAAFPPNGGEVVRGLGEGVFNRSQISFSSVAVEERVFRIGETVFLLNNAKDAEVPLHPTLARIISLFYGQDEKEESMKAELVLYDSSGVHSGKSKRHIQEVYLTSQREIRSVLDMSHATPRILSPKEYHLREVSGASDDVRDTFICASYRSEISKNLDEDPLFNHCDQATNGPFSRENFDLLRSISNALAMQLQLCRIELQKVKGKDNSLPTSSAVNHNAHTSVHSMMSFASTSPILGPTSAFTETLPRSSGFVESFSGFRETTSNTPSFTEARCTFVESTSSSSSSFAEATARADAFEDAAMSQESKRRKIKG
eukprot:TRINITY_DN2415_c0_g1_i1.p1 TRINITY_DN2415_c0_g1~~TRINITY_DN2415_c0_g1_i1.p1  ORF type:complete len:623 (-),score=160.02 TRINITY_DN2415_c0_g1_i1:358-2226(-)